MKPGDLYVGNAVDPNGATTNAPVGIPPRDLTTHAVIVGMTGSGKTGLGIVALEEALGVGVPTIVIDPKGDMGNLLLNFPDFAPASFQPWVSEDVARQKSMTVEALAQSTAETWKNGVASWDPRLTAIRHLHDSVEFGLFTPGSTAGVPLNIVGGLAAPSIDWNVDAELARDEIEGFVSSLLTLAGIEADPLSSREHILLANIIEKSWRAGKSLDLGSLLTQIPDPPIRKLGVFELDQFFPKKDRMALAMRLNALVASPSFSAWTSGPALDIPELLRSPDGKPRCSIVCISHLSETERQFFVTLLLSKVVTWMRTQPGSTDLRALVYMDEVFGFVPPTAAPPSKKPILTILKQARAFGVGLVLSTQNPVDLDYKAMSNAGTWLVGRLQTERDKARILEGLKSVEGPAQANLDALVTGLGKRQFLLHSAHRPAPALFGTRWAMSYLCGPLSRSQIATLTRESPLRAQAEAHAEQAAAAAPTPPKDDEIALAPDVHTGTPVRYLNPAANWAEAVGAVPAGQRYEAGLLFRVNLQFDEAKAGVDVHAEWEALLFPLQEKPDLAELRRVDYDDRDLIETPSDGANYVVPDVTIDKSPYFTQLTKQVKDHLYRSEHVSLFQNKALNFYSRIDEPRDEFEARCLAEAEGRADEEIQKLKAKFEAKMEKSGQRLVDAQRRLQELQLDVSARKQDEVVSGAGAVLGMLLGSRRTSGIASAAKRRAQVRKAQQRMQSAHGKIGDLEADLQELDRELLEAVDATQIKWHEAAEQIEPLQVGLEKNDINVAEAVLVWIPTA